MSKALLHLLNRELSRGWHAWHAMWEVLKAKRESMRKSDRPFVASWPVAWMGRVVRDGTGACRVHAEAPQGFELFREPQAGYRVCRLGVFAQPHAKQASQGHMSRALLHLLHREPSRGWSGWHSAWLELVAQRESMRKSLGHLLHRGLSRGWGAWVEMAVERAAFMQKLRKGAGHMMNRKLSAGLSGWREAIAPRTTQCRRRCCTS